MDRQKYMREKSARLSPGATAKVVVTTYNIAKASRFSAMSNVHPIYKYAVGESVSKCYT